MQIVAEQLLLDKDTDVVAAISTDYRRLFSEIGDRVFTGYELKQVVLEVSPNSKLLLYLQPWNTTISDVKVDLQFSGIDLRTAAILKKRIPNLENELKQIIIGASVDAVDWAGGILKSQVREKVEQALPDFKAAVDLINEEKSNQTFIQVVIYPVGQSIQDIEYELHSESIPNIILMKLKYHYAERCNELRGLPVSYLKRHQQELESIIVEELRHEKVIQEFDLHPTVSIIPGTDTHIDISLSTKKYKIWAEGYADLGRKKDNLSGKLHLGKYVSAKDEVFVEEELITDDVHWSTSLGYARSWGKSSWSYKRRIPESDNAYKFEYHFGPKWGLRMEHFSGNDRNEYALRYRIHEFLSCEYVYGGKESYFRIIGNL